MEKKFKSTRIKNNQWSSSQFRPHKNPWISSPQELLIPQMRGAFILLVLLRGLSFAGVRNWKLFARWIIPGLQCAALLWGLCWLRLSWGLEQEPSAWEKEGRDLTSVKLSACSLGCIGAYRFFSTPLFPAWWCAGMFIPSFLVRDKLCWEERNGWGVLWGQWGWSQRFGFVGGWAILLF